MSGFEIVSFTGGPFMTNSYLLIDEATQLCAVIDPTYEADEYWTRVINEKDLKLASIVITHGHIDHTAGAAGLARAFPDAEVLIHKTDEEMLVGANRSSTSAMGLPPYVGIQPTGYLEEGVPFKLGETEFDVFETPGHCPGHVVLVNGKTLIAGDVIFAGSIGRTDLPGGDYHLLSRSIVEKVMPLDDDVVIYSGHGPVTTIGQERELNPFVRDMLTP